MLRLGLERPAEGDRMTLGHIGAHDQYRIRIDQIAGEGSRTTATECDPQTGDRRGMSNSGLVFQIDPAQRMEQLLMGIVPFIIDGSAPQ